MARDAAAALRTSEAGEASRIVKSGAGLYNREHQQTLPTLDAALPDKSLSEKGRRGAAVQEEKRELERMRRERCAAAASGEIDYRARCPTELRGRSCAPKNASYGRCKYRFHAPKGYQGQKGAQPKYMRKDKVEFAEGEEEFEAWDKAAWGAFICKPCAS